MNLGIIIERDYRNITHTDRDNYLGTTSEIQESYIPDISWLTRNSQKNIPACSTHAASHIKAILDLPDTGINRYSPMSLWRYIKTFDGFSPSSGTSIEALFKGLKSFGISDWSLLTTDFDLSETVQAYTKLTQEQIDNAQPRIIKSYAITYYPSQDEIRRIISTDKVAGLLLRFDDTWWHSDVLEYHGSMKYGHFVCAYGYDKDYIYIIDSADDKYPYKKLGRNFAVTAIGSAVDLPDEYVKSLVKQRSLLQKIVELYRQLKLLITK